MNAGEWLNHAERLAFAPAQSDVDRRRSVSASYYAVFHRVAAGVVETFNAEASALRATLVHRSLTHERLRQVATETLKPVPSREYAPYWPNDGFGTELSNVARWTIELQQLRHVADYDPSASVSPLDAVLAWNTARGVYHDLDAADSELREVWLTLAVLRPYAR